MFPTIHSIIILGQTLVQLQFPLKLACALDVHFRRQFAASGSHTIEKVLDTKMVDFRERTWNDMKLHHPVLCGPWTSRGLNARTQRRVGLEILEILQNATEHDLFRCDFRQRYLSRFIVYLTGARGTAYDCGGFTAGFDIPVHYPFKPPKFTIFTKILHPNIGAESGEVCLDVLSECWSPAFSIHKVLLAVVALLAAPEPQDPANVEAAALQLNHPELFIEKARLWTRTYALPEPPRFRVLGICTTSSPKLPSIFSRFQGEIVSDAPGCSIF